MSYFGIPLRNGVGIGLGNAIAVNTSPIKGGPTLVLDFLNGTLDSRITFTRSTTATYTDSSGAIAIAAINAPRFDYNPITLAPKGLLIEEQRTNLLTYSEQFDNVLWAKTNSSITANAVIAPDGTSTADLIVPTITNGVHAINQTPVVTAVAHTETIYAKVGGYSWLAISLDGSNFVYYDLANGVLGTVGSNHTATITSAGNGWYRCSATRTFTAGARAVYCNVAFANNTPSFAGNGTSGIYIWGAQLEAGAFATSYIPTTIAQVTRTADAASMTGTNFSSWYNSNEGTVKISATPLGVDDIPFSISDSAGYANSLYFAAGASDFIVVSSSIVQTALNAGTWTTNVNSNISGAYKLNDFAAALNGAAPVLSSAGTIPIVNRATIGGLANNTPNIWNGTIKNITYYPRRLSNTELQVITA